MNYQMLREMIAARRKSFAFLVFLTVLNLAFFLYLSLWQRPALVRAQGEWQAARKAAAKGPVAGNAALYRDAQRDLGLFRQRLIPKKEFPRFLGELFQAVGANSLTLKGVTYKPALTKEPGVLSYGLTLNVSGRYPALKSFLADLSRFPELVTLDSLTLSNASPTGEVVELKLQLTVYLTAEGA
jgi:type IV pilus assembly protein PilO